MILDLAYYGDPYLRKRAQRVEKIDDQVRQLVADMMQTMDHHRGGGLASTQVRSPLRLFIARLDDSDNFEEWIRHPIEVFINPELIEPSETLIEDREGCLSIPGIHAKVWRPDRIRIQATDLEGNWIDRVYHGYLARQLMHENDHLNGVLYVDRLPKAQKQAMQKHLQQMLKRQKR